jgi:hypothetical protein
MHFRTIKDVKDFLKSRIFVVQPKGACLFEDDTYAVLPGNISLFLNRRDIAWSNIKAKHRYSIFQYESRFIFRTYKHELDSKENEFFISITDRENENYEVTFISLEGKAERLKLVAD